MPGHKKKSQGKKHSDESAEFTSNQDEISLIRKRAGLKSTLTRFCNFFDVLKNNSIIDKSKILELEMRINTLESNLLQEFSEIEFNLESLDPENYDNSDYASFESTYFSIIAEAKQFILQNSQQVEVQNNYYPINTSNRSSGVSLPRVELPKFSGVYERWFEFKDLFTSLIHNNSSLSTIEKFHYLRSYLEGSAAQCLSSLDFCEQNYVIAWEILCNRFDNKKLMVHKHIKSLFNIHEIKSDSPGALRFIVDFLSKNLKCLKNLGIETDSWDPLIIYLVISKLDSETLRNWEQQEFQNELPSLEELKSYLSNRADYLEKLNMHKEKPKHNFKGSVQKGFSGNSTTNVSKLVANKGKFACYVCKKPHSVYNCAEFLSLSIDQRRSKVVELKLCQNCLNRDHTLEQCKSGHCKKCKEKHNSLLHNDFHSESPRDQFSSSNMTTYNPISNSNHLNENNCNNINKNDTSSTSFYNYAKSDQVLLATAYVRVHDSQGTEYLCRALLDNGSMSNFVSQSFVEKLGILQHPIDFAVKGIGNSESHIKSSCIIDVKSMIGGFSSSLRCLIIPEITERLPLTEVNTDSFNIPENIQLADPEFYKPGRIDLLIGADTFWNILLNETVSLGKNMPFMQKTKLGWIISGAIGFPRSKVGTCNFAKTRDLHDQLVKFWELEEVSPISSHSQDELSNEELMAENHFCKTVTYNSDGRFVVAVPLKESITKLGDSKTTARQQFFNLERKLSSNPNLKSMYIEFMKEYKLLGHMSLYQPSKDEICYFSPHHGVMREESDTTKLRVVFNSSCPSTTGVSYNDLQMVGPVVQDDLFSILLRFRQHVYVFTADICKMYRQVLVRDEFKPLQLIFWRENPEDELQIFSLNTVTYGTASAPFLATRCIKELGIQNKSEYPQASRALNKDFYIDDVLSGSDSIAETIKLSNEVIGILKKAGFELRKWKSNCEAVIEGIKPNSSSSDSFYFSSSEKGKTLGLLWSSESDYFSFSINFSNGVQKITKRVILSEIARIFDPLGLLGPVIVQAKLLLQSLWLLKALWDQEVPEEFSQKWLIFRSELSQINKLKINRLVSCKNPKSIELHGFADASQKAYGACVYLRMVDQENKIVVNLLCSKSRVAPLKQISIPRLELCAALLLSILFNKVINSLTLQCDKCYLWSDSTVTLSWIRASPTALLPFVSHRVTKIQSFTSIQDWHYVPSESNPADCLSRGVSPKQLSNLPIWFSGPNWLGKNENSWPHDISVFKPISISNLPDVKIQNKSFIEINKICEFPFNRFSNLCRFKRCMAYILRFIYNLKNPQTKRLGILSCDELNQAMLVLVKISQKQSFPSEYQQLEKCGAINKNSRLLSLTPFMEDGIIRVGGRLKNSSYPFDKKHPAILSAEHHITYLIFRHFHLQLLHCGPQQLLSSVRECYWAISGRNLAKKTVRNCIRCVRYNPKPLYPSMGDLPEQRITPNLPFINVGVDYAEPFQIKDRKGRGCRVQKSYLCLFVCLVTKALHLELVSDLSTVGFLETFQRFIARRGRPSHIYSDNGTNFIGANNELRELGNFLKSSGSEFSDRLQTSLNIHWHFITAYNPHQGGLWEAGVKSAKHHIRRVLGNTLLTFENFYTIITQIESVLNSRPLTALSTDPNDLEALTPAHFLIGRSLQSIPYPDVRTLPTNRLSHFEQIEQVKQHFWSRWSKEYLSQLQQRTKWKINKCKVEVGAMVLILDENLPPFMWRLGRIVTLHPGKDKIVRIVSIKTACGIIKRSVVRICLLPVETEVQTNL